MTNQEDVNLNAIILPPLALAIVCFASTVSAFCLCCDSHYDSDDEDDVQTLHATHKHRNIKRRALQFALNELLPPVAVLAHRKHKVTLELLRRTHA